MSQAAFALKADRDLDCVGAIVIDTTRSINVRELLETDGETPDGIQAGPEGVYITDDPLEIERLDAYDPVKRITLSEAEDQQKKSRRRDTKTDAGKEG